MYSKFYPSFMYCKEYEDHMWKICDNTWSLCRVGVEVSQLSPVPGRAASSRVGRPDKWFVQRLHCSFCVERRFGTRLFACVTFFVDVAGRAARDGAGRPRSWARRPGLGSVCPKFSCAARCNPVHRVFSFISAGLVARDRGRLCAFPPHLNSKQDWRSIYWTKY